MTGRELRVCLPCVGDSVGGSHRAVIELYKGLKKRNVAACIVLHDKAGPLSAVLEDEGISFEHVSIPTLAPEPLSRLRIFFAFINNFFRLRSFINQQQITVVHGNDLRINLTWSAIARLSAVKYIWHQHSVLTGSRSWKFIPFLCTQFIAVSKFVLKSAPANLAASKKHLVLNPFDTECRHNHAEARKWLTEKYSVPANAVLLGYVGRLVESKNIPLLLEAVSKLGTLISDEKTIHLIIAGHARPEYQQQLADIADRYGIGKSITFTGFSNTPDMILAGLDISVIPSINDGFGRTLVESMLQGTPVLASRSGGHIEIVEHGHTGFLFEPNDIDDLVGKAAYLIEHTEKREEVAKQAFSYAEEKYDPEKFLEAILAIYRNK